MTAEILETPKDRSRLSQTQHTEVVLLMSASKTSRLHTHSSKEQFQSLS